MRNNKHTKLTVITVVAQVIDITISLRSSAFISFKMSSHIFSVSLQTSQANQPLVSIWQTLMAMDEVGYFCTHMVRTHRKAGVILEDGVEMPRSPKGKNSMGSRIYKSADYSS